MGDVFVVANPVRPHAAAAVHALKKRAAALGLPPPKVDWTTSADHGSGAAREAITEGAGVVVVAGGDGTARHVAGELAGTETEMAILPVGRGNVLAHNLGIRKLPKPDLVDIALVGRAATMGVGWARMEATGGHQGPEAFLTMAGIGNDAVAIDAMGHLGGWADYFVAGARRLLAPPLGFAVTLDHGPQEPVRAWSVFVGNQPRVPPGIELFPGAGGTAGHLVVAAVDPHGLVGWGRIAADRLRRAASNRFYRYRQASTVVVEPAVPATVHLDGDVFEGVVRASVALDSGVLRVRNALGPGMPFG